MFLILSKEDGELFDAYCGRKGFKKSTLINRLIREHIENSDFRLQKELFNTQPAEREVNDKK